MAWAAVQCVARRVPMKDGHESWLVRRRLITHADRCLEMLRDQEIDNAAVSALDSLGLFYWDQGRLQEADVMCE